MSVTINGTNGVTFNDGSVQPSAPVGKNKIINGDMTIDQRNSGASVTPLTGTYTLDRYRAFQNAAGKFTLQQSSTAPDGFSKSVQITSTSAHTVAAGELFLFMQYIEGYNVADLAYGTSDAQTITISFYVRSSLTGTFGGALLNGAEDRNYPFTYTISSADTWERKTVTIAGDTSGTWLKTNGLGLQVNFSMGMGSTYTGSAGAWASGAKFSATGATSVVATSGATWNMTGLQVEKNTTATPFEHLQYGQQFALCQRYYQVHDQSVNAYYNAGIIGFPFNTVMRASPTLTLSYSGTANRVYRLDTGATADLTIAASVMTTSGFNHLYAFTPSGWASAAGVGFRSNFVFNAEF